MYSSLLTVGSSPGTVDELSLADATNLDVEALRRYMKGKQIMGIDKLYRIATALGVDVGDLFN
jgi:transcriptional regulator with XRE-family HTH domain